MDMEKTKNSVQFFKLKNEKFLKSYQDGLEKLKDEILNSFLKDYKISKEDFISLNKEDFLNLVNEDILSGKLKLEVGEYCSYYILKVNGLLEFKYNSKDFIEFGLIGVVNLYDSILA